MTPPFLFIFHRKEISKPSQVFYFLIVPSGHHVLSPYNPYAGQTLSGGVCCTSPLIILPAFGIFLLIFCKATVSDLSK